MTKTANNKTTDAPKTDDKADAKKKARKAARAEVKAAKVLVNEFKETKEFKALPKNVREAIARLTKVSERSGGGSRTTLADQLKAMFPKVGDAVHELDIFKAQKWGRGEMRKRVRHALKKADKADRLWIKFDEKAESWVLVAIGGDVPEGFVPVKK